jgi:predicted Fe-Mo cluster-binding NifX family protein
MTTQQFGPGSCGGAVRLAVATSNGERVDQHFSRSQFFDIYDVEKDSWTFVEHRPNPASSCGCHDEHGGTAFDAILEFLSDCRFVVAQRIGNGALSYLIDRGVRAAQIDDTVENALRTLVTSGKLSRILKRKP